MKEAGSHVFHFAIIEIFFYFLMSNQWCFYYISSCKENRENSFHPRTLAQEAAGLPHMLFTLHKQLGKSDRWLGTGTDSPGRLCGLAAVATRRYNDAGVVSTTTPGR